MTAHSDLVARLEGASEGSREFTFTVAITAKVTVPETDENLARYAILETLQDADTDFIRSGHWERSGILAEFHIDKIGEVRAKEPQPDGEKT